MKIMNRNCTRPSHISAIFLLLALFGTQKREGAGTTVVVNAFILQPPTITPNANRYTRKLRASSNFKENYPFPFQREELLPVIPTTSRRELFRTLTAGALTLGTAAATKSYPALAAVSSSPPTSVCDPCVTVWRKDKRLIYLLGTAHISTVSADLAAQLVQDVHPQAVFVELDIKRVGGVPSSARVTTLSNQLKLSPPDGSNGNLIIPRIDERQLFSTMTTTNSNSIAQQPTTSMSTISNTPSLSSSSSTQTSLKGGDDGGGAGGLLMQVGARAVGGAIRGMYQKLEKQGGFQPGLEFVKAVQEGQKINADIILGDRDVQVTLRRLTQALAVTDIAKLTDPNSDLEQNMKALLPGGSSSGSSADMANTNPEAWKTELSTYIEAIKTREKVTEIMNQLREVAPELVQVMLTERDAYMAAGLDMLDEEDTIVAVMGIAHVDGVERNLKARGWTQVKINCPKRS